MARESVLRSVVPIDIRRTKDEICTQGIKDTKETNERGGGVIGIRVTRECDCNKDVQKNCC